MLGTVKCIQNVVQRCNLHSRFFFHEEQYKAILNSAIDCEHENRALKENYASDLQESCWLKVETLQD